MVKKLSGSDKQLLKKYHDNIDKIKKEVSKIVVGQQDIVDGCLRAILANGHVLIEGLPGVAKTLVVRTLAKATGCDNGRVQFTVDLLPADILGIQAYDSKKGFYTIKGPIFTNFVIADEINRAPPKTQSALLEGMQEKQVTINKKTFSLPLPFFVMATVNPLESGGVYPLPEAQLDRFMYKLIMPYPEMENEKIILRRNMSLYGFDHFKIKSVISASVIQKMQDFVKEKIYLGDKVEKYILRLVDATRNPDDYKLKKAKYLEYGASPRASIAMFISAKADAVLSNQEYVTPQNVKNVAADILRHRILINYEGQAEGLTSDEVIEEILERVPIP